MNQLISASLAMLDQLKQVILEIEPEDYSKPCQALSGSSIGQHLRHSLELFSCLESGYYSGIVNYDNRPRNKRLETERDAVVAAIYQVSQFLGNTHNRPLLLDLSLSVDVEESISIETTFHRELAYNIDHVVHHLAIMKIGLKEVAPYIGLSPDFGIASSTVRHRNKQEEHAVVGTGVKE